MYGNDQIGGTLEHVHRAWKEQGKSVFEQRDVIVHQLAVFNFVKDYQDQFLSEMSAWVKDGLITYKEDIWQGLEKAPEAFSAMLSGGNFGKTLVQISGDPNLT